MNEFEPSEYEPNIAGYAAKGYNLIIAHGSQYGSTIEQLAPQYPKTSFAWGTAGSTFGLKNVFAYEANSNEGGYVQGYMAALLSKSKVLGICGPIATGDAKLYVDGFQAGAKAAAKANGFKVTAHAVYTGSFSDDSLMAACAKTFVATGPTCSPAAPSRSSGRSASRSRTTGCGSVPSGTRPRLRRTTSFLPRSTTGSRS